MPPPAAWISMSQASTDLLLRRLPEDSRRACADIELALSTINELLTGDLEHVPSVVAADMSRWLERNKHLAESAVVAKIDPITSPYLVAQEAADSGPIVS